MPFIDWWQTLPLHINPVALQLGSFSIRWYGLMYVVAFAVVYLLTLHRVKKEGYRYSKDFLQGYLLWAAAGLLIGGRLGHVLFEASHYIRQPLEIFLPVSFSGGLHYAGIAGMSFHGGLAGIIIASFFYLRRRKVDFWSFADFFVPCIPMGYFFGRIGNFLNGELYGRLTDSAWGMFFAVDPINPRIPTQLLEALFEGIVLFALLWSMRRAKVFDGFMLALYLMGYGAARFIIEFFREPLGSPMLGMTPGQLFSALMVIAGCVILAVGYLKKRKNA